MRLTTVVEAGVDGVPIGVLQLHEERTDGPSRGVRAGDRPGRDGQLRCCSGCDGKRSRSFPAYPVGLAAVQRVLEKLSATTENAEVPAGMFPLVLSTVTVHVEVDLLGTRTQVVDDG